jgi:hypothetical protein
MILILTLFSVALKAHPRTNSKDQLVVADMQVPNIPIAVDQNCRDVSTICFAFKYDKPITFNKFHMKFPATVANLGRKILDNKLGAVNRVLKKPTKLHQSHTN